MKDWFERYLESSKQKPSVLPVISFEGEILKWLKVNDRGLLWPSDLPNVLYFCTYELGLETKYGEGASKVLEGELEGRRGERREGLEKAILEGGLEVLEKDIEDLDGKLGRTRDLEKGEEKLKKGGDILHRILKEKKVMRPKSIEEVPRLLYGKEVCRSDEFPIVGFYKGLGFSGKLDHIKLLLDGKGGLEKIEVLERKFPKDGKVREDMKLQLGIYCYSLGNIFPVPISYSLHIFDGKEVPGGDREIKVRFAEKKNLRPCIVESGLWDSKMGVKLEGSLERILGFFTGQIPCEPKQSIGCKWCNFKYKCPYYEDYWDLPSIKI